MENKTIMKMRNDEDKREKATIFIARHFVDNKNIYDLSRTLQDKLGLGGLWNGSEIALSEIMKTMLEAQKTKQGETNPAVIKLAEKIGTILEKTEAK